MTEVVKNNKKSVLIRAPGFAPRAGETREFTKRRQKNEAKRKLQKAQRRKNRGK